MSQPEVPVALRRLDGADAAIPLPAYKTAGAAGADVCANLPASDRDAGVVLRAGGRRAVPTGLALAIPPGFEVQIRPRSGLARSHGVTLVNAPGTIDADYRGEVMVLLINLGTEDLQITHGMRIAQMVLAPVTRAIWAETQDLDDTTRGTGGFGSTGV